MSSENKNNSVTELLAAINAANKQTGFDIWIPSLKKNVKFGDITTGQQKEMIRALVDNPVYRTNFILAFAELVLQNCQETIDIAGLSIFDKTAIVIQLRQKSTGNIVTIDTDGGKFKVDLSQVDPVTKFAVPDTFTKPVEVKHGVFSLTLTVPSINREARLEKELRSKLGKTVIESYDDVRNVIADAYIGEIAKYTTKLVVDTRHQELSQLSFKQVYEIVESLPAPLVRQAVAYLEQVQAELVKMTTFNGVGDQGNLDVQITLDAAFFAGK